MAYHETRVAPGDPGSEGGGEAGVQGQVIAYVDDEGQAHYPGSEGYVDPDGSFLADQAAEANEGQPAPPPGEANDASENPPAPSAQ